MEEAVRNARSTVYSSSSNNGSLKRCNILETSAYMSMRLKLLRWLGDYNEQPKNNEEGNNNEGILETVRFHIGEGISIRGEYGDCKGLPPKVELTWRHSDNDGTLPVVAGLETKQPCKRQPRLDNQDDDDEDEENKKLTLKRKKQ